MDIEILERLHSKRNQVYKIRLREESSTLAVMKKYNSNDHELLEAEYQNMQMLQRQGILIPKIIHKSKDNLILEYIQGDLAADLAQNLDMGGWIDSLASWMAQLHKVTGDLGSLLKGDVNLRNFIYSGGYIYGLDFEDLDFGDSRRDLANICFFMLTNYPSFTKEKHIMVRRFLHSYEDCSGTKLKNMGRYLLQSRTEAKKRRTGRIIN